ncbi:hypothetical protein OAS39_06095 [Pirellulales bacterium]|nr:hypothetical protein [Pirellulales bacterium]
MWHHLQVTRNPENRTVDVVVDGEAVGSFDLTIVDPIVAEGITLGADQDIVLGGYGNNPEALLEGDLAELRFSERGQVIASYPTEISWQELGDIEVGQNGELLVSLQGDDTGNLAVDALRIERSVLPYLETLDLRGNPLDNAAYEYVLHGLRLNRPGQDNPLTTQTEYAGLAEPAEDSNSALQQGLIIDTDTGPPVLVDLEEHLPIELRKTTALGTITFDSGNSDIVTDPGGSIAFSRMTHEIGHGDNRVLVVGTMGEIGQGDGAASVSLIPGDGGPSLQLTEIVTAASGDLGSDGEVVARLWYLLSPQVGTHQIQVDWNHQVGQPAARAFGAVSLFGVAQELPMVTVGNDSIELTTSTDGAWVVDIFAINSAEIRNSGSAARSQPGLPRMVAQWSEDVRTLNSSGGSLAGVGAAMSTRPVPQTSQIENSWSHLDPTPGAGIKFVLAAAAFAPAQIALAPTTVVNFTVDAAHVQPVTLQSHNDSVDALISQVVPGRVVGQASTVATSDASGMFDVDVSADGRKVVVWRESDSVIKAGRIDASGTPLLPIVEVSAGSEVAEYPRVAINDSGEFAIVWTSQGSTANSRSINFKRFSWDDAELTASKTVLGDDTQHDSLYAEADIDINSAGTMAIAYYIKSAFVPNPSPDVVGTGDNARVDNEVAVAVFDGTNQRGETVTIREWDPNVGEDGAWIGFGGHKQPRVSFAGDDIFVAATIRDNVGSYARVFDLNDLETTNNPVLLTSATGPFHRLEDISGSRSGNFGTTWVRSEDGNNSYLYFRRYSIPQGGLQLSPLDRREVLVNDNIAQFVDGFGSSIEVQDDGSAIIAWQTGANGQIMSGFFASDATIWPASIVVGRPSSESAAGPDASATSLGLLPDGTAIVLWDNGGEVVQQNVSRDGARLILTAPDAAAGFGTVTVTASDDLDGLGGRTDRRTLFVGLNTNSIYGVSFDDLDGDGALDFVDLDADGVRDPREPGEPGLEGTLILVDVNANGELDETLGERIVVTDVFGRYILADPPNDSTELQILAESYVTTLADLPTPLSGSVDFANLRVVFAGDDQREIEDDGQLRRIREGDAINLPGIIRNPDRSDEGSFIAMWSIVYENSQIVFEETRSITEFTEDTTGVWLTSFPITDFRPADNGVFDATLGVFDFGSNSAYYDSVRIEVENAAPTASILEAPTVAVEGDRIELGAGFEDPGTADTPIAYQWRFEAISYPRGDFDKDFDVDGRDFLRWQRETSDATSGAADLRSFQESFGEIVRVFVNPGDFDEDSDSDGHDFLKWQRGDSGGPVTTADLKRWETGYGAAGTVAIQVDDYDREQLFEITGSIEGDYDGDAIVAGNDFLLWQRGGLDDPLSPADLVSWQRNFGAQGETSTSTSLGGDFDGDTAVGGDDFLVWQRGGSGDPLSIEDLDTWQRSFGADATNFTFTPVDEGLYLVELRVQDDDGAWSDWAREVITVANADPNVAVTLGGVPVTPITTIFENRVEPVTFEVQATDPGALDSLSFEWDLTYDGQDFSRDRVGRSITQLFANEEVVRIAVRVRDNDFHTDVDQEAEADGEVLVDFTLNVQNDKPEIVGGISGPTNPTEGQAVGYSVNAIDAGEDTLEYAWLFDYDLDEDEFDMPDLTGATVNWAFPDAGSYVIGVRVSDGTDFVIEPLTVNVGDVRANVSITASGIGTNGEILSKITEGDTVLFSSTVVEPGIIDLGDTALNVDSLNFAWTINGRPLGESFNRDNVELSWQQLRGFGVDDGTRTYTVDLTVTVSDPDFPTASASGVFQVENRVPSALDINVLSPANNIYERDLVTVIGEFQDPGADDWIYTWQFFNSKGHLIDQSTNSVPEFRFTPADDGNYSVVMTVNDGEDEARFEQPIEVRNAAPDLNATVNGQKRVITKVSDTVNISGWFTDEGRADVWQARVVIAGIAAQADSDDNGIVAGTDLLGWQRSLNTPGGGSWRLQPGFGSRPE